MFQNQHSRSSVSISYLSVIQTRISQSFAIGFNIFKQMKNRTGVIISNLPLRVTDGGVKDLQELGDRGLVKTVHFSHV